MPLPPMESENGAPWTQRPKPVVINKVSAGPMSEDGRDWGERCVDMYKIVDKVMTDILKVANFYIATFVLS